MAQSVTVKSTGCEFDSHSRKWKIFSNLYFHFFALVSWQSAALRFATRHAMPQQSSEYSAESGERNVLTLDSLCLPCYVWDTAWSWFNFDLIFRTVLVRIQQEKSSVKKFRLPFSRTRANVSCWVAPPDSTLSCFLSKRGNINEFPY